jgi:WD40 repeat protein
MPTSPRYDVFLSHNRADQPAVEELGRRLIAAGLQPFLDRWHLIPGQPWQEALENALADSASAAVFIGPSGISPWHNEELRAALDEAVRTRDDYRVIPVLLPGADEAAVARFLARRTWVDFRAGLDDAEAFGRLVAGIQGQAAEVGPYRLPDEPAPYRGLLRFEAEHARFFFGRDADTRRLVEKLGQHPFVAVIGASGSGKSSLVRAGLLPALAANVLPDSSRWHVLTFTPGSQPLQSLAAQLATFVPLVDRPRALKELTASLQDDPAALRSTLVAYLADKPRPALLFVDQFEELFTLCADGAERCRAEAEQFIALLADAAERSDGQVRIVITLRADFLDRCLAFPALRGLLEDRQLLLGPLTAADLREAIVRPAQADGAFLEKGLVNAILRDAGDKPGVLPWLQHALYELWLARRGPWLTLDAYDRSGGVAGALGRRAQDTYDALSPEQKIIARAIFLRLTALGEGVSDTRRRADRRELYPVGTDPAQVDAVIQALSGPNARLLVADEEAVEVAHEALIQGWSTLHSWLEEDSEALRLHRRLTDAAKEWQAAGREASLLYRGAALTQTAEWAEANPGQLNKLERDFLDASLKTATRAARLRTGLLIAFALLILAVGLVYGWSQGRLADQERAAAATADHLRGQEVLARQTAEAERNRAEEQARVARSRQIAAFAEAARPAAPQRSLLLSIEALRQTLDAGEPAVTAAEGALRQALALFSGHTLGGHLGNVTVVAISPDGRWLASGGGNLFTQAGDPYLHWWDLAAADPATAHGTIPLDGGFLFDVRFSPDGRWLAGVTLEVRDGAWLTALRRWEVTGAGLRPTSWRSQSDQVFLPVGFSADSRWLVADQGDLLSSRSNALTLWDLAAATAISSTLSLTGLEKVFPAVEPDQRWLAASDADGRLHVWNLVGLKPLAAPVSLPGTGAVVQNVALSRNGRWLAASRDDGAGQLWDLTAPDKPPPSLAADGSRIRELALSPDGRWLVAGSSDARVRLWRLGPSGPSGSAQELSNPGTGIFRLTISPDSRWLALTTLNHPIAYLWDLAAGEPATTRRDLMGHQGDIGWLAVTADSHWLATAGDDGAVRLWDLTAADPAADPVVLAGRDAAGGIALSQDGRWLAARGMGAVFLHDLTQPLPARIDEIRSGRLGDAEAFTLAPDDRWLVTAHDYHTVLWDLSAAVARSRVIITGATYGRQSVALSPDGRWLVTGGLDATVRLWDMQAADPAAAVSVLPGPTAAIRRVNVSRDNAELLAVTADGRVYRWSLAAPGRPVVAQALPGSDGALGAVLVSPDNRWVVTGFAAPTLFTGSPDRTLLWDTVRPDGPLTLSSEQSRTSVAAFSADGRFLVTGRIDGSVRVWDLAAADPTANPRLLKGNPHLITALAVSPDGRRVVIGTGSQLLRERDYSVRLWDLTAADPAAPPLILRGHTTDVSTLAISGDSRWLATGDRAGQLYVWDLTAGQPGATARPLPGHGKGITGLAFDAGDRTLVSAGSDGAIRFWPLRADALIARACRAAGRNLTASEWQSYFPGEEYRITCDRWPGQP